MCVISPFTAAREATPPAPAGHAGPGASGRLPAGEAGGMRYRDYVVDGIEFAKDLVTRT